MNSIAVTMQSEKDEVHRWKGPSKSNVTNPRACLRSSACFRKAAVLIGSIDDLSPAPSAWPVIGLVPKVNYSTELSPSKEFPLEVISG